MVDFATKLIRERENTHGDYETGCRVYAALKAAIYEERDFTPEHALAIDLICLKLSRIASGDASHEDHWDDIAGYAQLAKTERKDK